MNRIKSFPLALLLPLIYFGAALASPPPANPSDQELYPVPLTRPCTSALCRNIGQGSIALSKGNAVLIAELITELDAKHLGLLKTSEISFLPGTDTNTWMKIISKPCHPRTPLPERSIYAALYLQLLMLDRALYTEDHDRAVDLRASRNKIKLRDKNDCFFGDLRDQYVCDLLVILEHIGQIQSAFGIEGTTDWHFPKNIETQEQLEDFIIAKIKWVRDRTDLLIDLRNGADR